MDTVAEQARLERRAGGDAASKENARIHAVARLTLAFVFVWHGVVPKLLFPHPDEARMLMDGGVSAELAPRLVTALGVFDVALGLALLVFWRTRALLVVPIVLVCGFTAGVALFSPQFIGAAFTPVTFNLCVAALGAVGYLAARDRPTARRGR